MTEQFTSEEVAIVSPYVSNTDRPVFVVQNLPEEVVAVLFAYYSRSKESLRRNLLKLIREQDVEIGGGTRIEGASGGLAQAREKAKQFHEKWVVGYGHASVAEHAIAHIAIEDVSIVVSKIIEDNRLASYTEKSTRYVAFDSEKYYKAPELDATPYAGLYHETAGLLMRRYAELTPLAIDKIKEMTPQREGQTNLAYNSGCRSKACDVLRYMLPAAAFTNIGLTANGRALEHMITKLLSSRLAEAREFGRAIKQEAEKVIPTLLKYAEFNPYIAETEAEMIRIAGALTGELADAGPPEPAGNLVTLVRYDREAEDRLITAILYPHAGRSAFEIEERVAAMTRQEKEAIIDEYLKRRGKWDEPLRALEHVCYTFEILVDYGAFRDIQRHRMATQSTQLLGDAHGYETPPEIIDYGYEDVFVGLMERASRAYRTIAAELPREAQYVLPMAYRNRSLFTWNLRSLHHFISLRSARQGHPSYRNIAQKIFHEIERVHPLLAHYIKVDLGDYAFARL